MATPKVALWVAGAAILVSLGSSAPSVHAQTNTGPAPSSLIDRSAEAGGEAAVTDDRVGVTAPFGSLPNNVGMSSSSREGDAAISRPQGLALDRLLASLPIGLLGLIGGLGVIGLIWPRVVIERTERAKVSGQTAGTV